MRILNAGRKENLGKQIQFHTINYKVKPVGDAPTSPNWWLWHRGIYEIEVRKVKNPDIRGADEMLKWYEELTNQIHNDLGCFGYCKIPRGLKILEPMAKNSKRVLSKFLVTEVNFRLGRQQIKDIDNV